MSAALQLPTVWAAESIAPQAVTKQSSSCLKSSAASRKIGAAPTVSVAFYRRHTEKMLRRYLYASMLVGRAPSILGEPIGRGWVSSRKVKTFEDAVIFVLDIERCLKKLGSLDCMILSRVALQEYTHVETAKILGVSPRAISYKYPLALDRLTELLLQSRAADSSVLLIQSPNNTEGERRLAFPFLLCKIMPWNAMSVPFRSTFENSQALSMSCSKGMASTRP